MPVQTGYVYIMELILSQALSSLPWRTITFKVASSSLRHGATAIRRFFPFGGDTHVPSTPITLWFSATLHRSVL